MTDILAQCLSLLSLYGYPLLILAILLNDIGLPIPVTSLIIASGSFAAAGNFNLILLILIVAASAIIGDCIGFFLGRYFGRPVLQKLLSFTRISHKPIQKSEKLFREYGFWWVFLTRWLITPMCVPLNILAGSSLYSFPKFFVAVVLGETIWTILYISLGYLLQTNGSVLINYFGYVPVIATGGVFVLGLFLLWKKKK